MLNGLILFGSMNLQYLTNLNILQLYSIGIKKGKALDSAETS